MNSLRKNINNNKGLVALLLVLFFLTAGLSKSIASFLSLHSDVVSASHNTAHKQLLSCAGNGSSSFTFLDQLKDTDTDDAEFAFFGHDYTTSFLPSFDKAYKFPQFVAYNNVYSGQLYDLYCNWKFHLS